MFTSNSKVLLSPCSNIGMAPAVTHYVYLSPISLVSPPSLVSVCVQAYCMCVAVWVYGGPLGTLFKIAMHMHVFFSLTYTKETKLLYKKPHTHTSEITHTTETLSHIQLKIS